MLKYIALLIAMIAMSVSVAFGVDSEVPAQVSSIGDKIMAFIEGVSPVTMTVILGAMEFLFRAIKTKKPLSVLRGVIAVGKYVCNVVLGVLSFLDKIIPQNVDENVPAVSQKLK